MEIKIMRLISYFKNYSEKNKIKYKKKEEEEGENNIFYSSLFLIFLSHSSSSLYNKGEKA